MEKVTNNSKYHLNVNYYSKCFFFCYCRRSLEMRANDVETLVRNIEEKH